MFPLCEIPSFRRLTRRNNETYAGHRFWLSLPSFLLPVAGHVRKAQKTFALTRKNKIVFLRTNRKKNILRESSENKLSQRFTEFDLLPRTASRTWQKKPLIGKTL